jgi:hypothetical protein
MCELGEFAKMQFNLIRISCEFHACSEISFKSIWSRYRSDRTEFQARASIRSGDPLWRPELFQPKKPFMRVLMTQEQLKCMPIYYPFLCVHSFCLVSDLRPGMEYHAAKATRWICRTGSSSFIFCRRFPIRSFTMQGIQNVAFEQSRQTRRDLQRYFAV